MQCLYDQELRYAEVLAWPGNASLDKVTPTSESQLSVLMIFIDSLSSSAVQRHLPQTYRYITEKMGFNVSARPVYRIQRREGGQGPIFDDGGGQGPQISKFLQNHKGPPLCANRDLRFREGAMAPCPPCIRAW